MTFKDFKTNLQAILAANSDNKLPADELLKSLMLQALTQVASEYNPLVLMSDDERADILKPFENGLYILNPILPDSDEDEILIDKSLIYAVMYKTAFLAGKKKSVYDSEFRKTINDHKWARYEQDRNSDYRFDRSYTENLIDLYGYKKIYKSKDELLTGVVYEFDMEFVSLVNDYFSGTVREMTRSDKKNLDKYVSFASGKMSEDHAEYLDFFKFNEYLGAY